MGDPEAESFLILLFLILASLATWRFNLFVFTSNLHQFEDRFP